MASIELTIISILRALVEVAGMSLLAQGGACFKRRTPGSRAHAH